MKKFILLAVSLILGWSMAGCGEDSKLRPNTRPPAKPYVSVTPSPAFAPNAQNVKLLCDYVYKQSIETLARPNVQGNITLYASRSGIPQHLVEATQFVYEDALVQDPDKNKTEVQRRYDAVIGACENAGTKWKKS